ncbi:hypothetical protein ACJMK2_018689, partial [Sinanodonta woodiana]
SYHMEKEGLARAIRKLQSHGAEVVTINTDRHIQIQKWIRENKTATHYFDDVRNWIRSISNHLYWCAASGEPEHGDLSVAKWYYVANQVQNRQTHANSLFPSCLYDCLPEANERYKRSQSLSPIHQTYNLESLHSVMNHFAPKMLAISYNGMRN